MGFDGRQTRRSQEPVPSVQERGKASLEEGCGEDRELGTDSVPVKRQVLVKTDWM